MDENGQPKLDADEQGRYQVGEELYMVSLSQHEQWLSFSGIPLMKERQMRQITSKPVDAMLMTVGLAQ